MSRRPSESGQQDLVLDMLDGDTSETVPIDLHVEKLGYSVTDVPASWWQKIYNLQMPWEWLEKGKTTQVLNEVSFTAESGKLMAVMGGSGSGKTSLLDVLAYRSSTGTITGDVYLNSVPCTKRLFSRCAGYVRQDDRLIGFLTTRETLMFVAHLKLPRMFTSAMIRNRVDLVISELGLKHVENTKVGSSTIRGLSGGERRRVSIGIQLLILPSILLLDEPTSGLDSFTAKHITQSLSRLASKKRTIIMSIHQPRFDIFNVVDTLMILSRGRIVYNGPGKEMVAYFTAAGYPCPRHTNPCDHYIDLATVDNTSKAREEASIKVIESLQNSYQVTCHAQMSTCSDAEDAIDTIFDKSQTKRSESRMSQNVRSMDQESLEKRVEAFEREREGPRLLFQFYILWRRFIRIIADDYMSLLTHVIEALLMSLLLGMVYWDLKYDQQSVRDWFGVMFMISVMYPFMVVIGLVSACHEERRYLYFELQDKLYSPAAFYFAKIFSQVPFHLFLVVIYCIPVYGMAGLKIDAYSCGLFYLFVSVSVFVSRCLAMMSAAILPTFQISSFFAQILFSLFIMSAGFFININSMLTETKWISEGSYLRWGFQALCIIGIKDLEYQCNTPDCVKPTISGEDALSMFAFGDFELWKCALGLGIPMVVFLGIMFLGLRFVPQKPVNE